MRTFVDNTAIHQISSVMEEGNGEKPIRVSDALALFHLAEHIMFSEQLRVSTFELDFIQERTEKTIERLVSSGAIKGGVEPAIKPIDYSIEDYADACNDAVHGLEADLALLDTETIHKWCNLASSSTTPIGIRGSRLDKWITEDWSTEERIELSKSALEEKAAGAYDYIIGKNDAVYGYIKELTRTIHKGEEADAVAAFIDVFFRVHINVQLGAREQAVYSPAPQRALVARKGETLFRQAVEKVIQNDIVKHEIKYASPLLEKLLKCETVPLPLFALHFLRKEDVDTPLKMIESAQKLRTTSSDIKEIMKWLNKWEETYSSGSLENLEAGKNELKKLADDLSIIRSDKPLFSVIRFKPSTSMDGPLDPSIETDLDGVKSYLRKLRLQAHRPKMFLSAIRREFEFDSTIGADICRMLGRPLVK